jgi:hypothetical protein
LEDTNKIPAEQGGDEYLVNGAMISILAAKSARKEGDSDNE